MPIISVISPTIRPMGLEIVAKALKRQTLEAFEWIICSNESLRNEIVKYTRGIDYRFIGRPPLKKGMYWDLNSSYNSLIRQAKGELIVSWQDYTYAQPDALSRFWNVYLDNPYSIVSGVGNKYKDDTWTVKTWQDPRQRTDQGSFYECYPWDIEGNFSAVPKQAFLDVGGFDEEMDQIAYGFDARGVFERIDLMGGYKFFLDQANESFSLEHDRPQGWDENNFINKWTDYKQKNLDNKRYPILQYLNKQSSGKESAVNS